MTQARGINNSGTVVGFYDTADGYAGFVYDVATGTYTTLNDPLGAGITFLEGINDAGLISGAYDDINQVEHAFLYDPATATFTTVDVPGSTFSEGWQVNGLGQLVITTDVGSFVYAPVPEPATLSLLLLGLAFLGFALPLRSPIPRPFAALLQTQAAELRMT